MDDNVQIVRTNGQAFGAFTPVSTGATSGQVEVPRDRSTNQQILKRLSNQLIATFKKCNPVSNWSGALARIVLTNPSEGVYNNGNDNISHDLILYRNADVEEPSGRRYKVKEVLGKGIFGQVVKCYCEELDTYVAIKVIKNEPNYHRQAKEEIRILGVIKKKLNEKAGRKTIVEIVHHFEFQSHVCIVFDLMSINLYDLIRRNRFRGFSMTLVRSFTKQLLDAMVILRECKIIHADIKPENILLRQIGSPEITLIDFGSACFEGCTIYSYVQSRFYRSPEVIVGYPYNAAIDMWSLGCVSAELAVGWPLFPGPTEYNLLIRIRETLGDLPPDLIRLSRKSARFYRQSESGDCVLKNQSEMEEPPEVEARANKRFFSDTALQGIIFKYPYKNGMDEAEKKAEQLARVAFVHFLRGLLNTDPARRWTPQQAACHPFITGEPFTGEFVPPPDSFDPPVGVLPGPSSVAHTWSGGLHLGLNNPNFPPMQPQNLQLFTSNGVPGMQYPGGMRPTTTNIPYILPQSIQSLQHMGTAGYLSSQDPLGSSVPRNLFPLNNSVLQYPQHHQSAGQGQQSLVPTITFQDKMQSQSFNNSTQRPLSSMGSIAAAPSLGSQRTYDYGPFHSNYRSRLREEEYRNQSRKRRDTDQSTSNSSELTVSSTYENSLHKINANSEHLSPRHKTNASNVVNGSHVDAQSAMLNNSGANFDQAGMLQTMGNQYANAAIPQKFWNQMALASAFGLHPQGSSQGHRISHENSEQCSIQQSNQMYVSHFNNMSNTDSPDIDDEMVESEVDEDSENSATEL